MVVVVQVTNHLEQINRESGKFFTPFCLKMETEYFTKIFTQMHSIVLDTWLMERITGKIG